MASHAFLVGPALVAALLLVGPTAAGAQQGPRVVRTLGDPGEATCVQASGPTLWIGTLGAGIVRVQGSGQQRFDATSGLAGNRVRDCALHAGAPWVATEAGLSRFDPSTERFQTIGRGRYLRLAAAGRVLIAARADGAVQRFVDGALAGEQAVSSVPSALVVSEDGRWALGGVDGALYAAAATRLRRVRIAERASGAAEPIEQLSLRGGALIATTASRVLRIADWSAAALARPAAIAASAQARAADPIAALPAGVLVHDRARFMDAEVFATDAGVFVQNLPGETAAPLALGGQPCGDRISALAVQGSLLWVGSFDRGLCRFDGRIWVPFRAPRQLPSDMVNALTVLGDTLYVATAHGLTVVDAGGAFTSFTHEQCQGRLGARCPWHAAVNGVAADAKNGQVWVADIGAVHRIDARTGRWHHEGARAGIGSSSLTRIAAFAGETAIGTSDQGLYLLRGGGKARALSDQDGLADNWITDLAYDARGRLWIATCTRGVSVRDERGAFRTLTTRDGLADDYALSVQELAGKIWIGTLRGLNVVDGERITTLSVADGLSGNEVHDAVEFAGEVWVATDGGLSVIAEAEAGAPKSAPAPVYSPGAR